MLKSVKSKAEEQFTATQKKDKQVLKEREKVWDDRVKHMAALKALRLVKEAADKEAAAEAAEKAAAEKAVAKNKKSSRATVHSAGGEPGAAPTIDKKK